MTATSNAAFTTSASTTSASTSSASTTGASDAWLLRQRGREVTSARERLVAERDAAPRNWDSRPAHQELLAALERLDAVSMRIGVPLSYRLHAELEMYRRLASRL